MSGAIGYYVHHQGRGHLDRALLLANVLGDNVTMLGTGLMDRVQRHSYVDLPDDRLDDGFAGEDGTGQQSLSLHYAPLGHAGVRARTALVANWIEQASPTVFVVDVSVEVAMLARLASVPVIYVRLAGLRTDPPHVEAFRGARGLLAPFDARLDDPAVPNWIRDKTFYAPGLCERPSPTPPAARLIVVILGRGSGPPPGPDRLIAMARKLSGWTIRVLGEVGRTPNLPPNLNLMGWVDDVAAEIGSAALVVGAAGDGVVNLVLASHKPFICIPETRPYDEQLSKARALKRQGVALVCEQWPEAPQWPSLVDAAIDLAGQATHDLDDAQGLAKAAGFIRALSTPPLLSSNEVASCA